MNSNITLEENHPKEKKSFSSLLEQLALHDINEIYNDNNNDVEHEIFNQILETNTFATGEDFSLFLPINLFNLDNIIEPKVLNNNTSSIVRKNLLFENITDVMSIVKQIFIKMLKLIT